MITFLQTGGTIDKDYLAGEGNHGYNFLIGEAATTEILVQARVHFEYSIESILQKDSLDVTDEDRALIVAYCQKLTGDKVIITHGTDTICQTAEALEAGNIKKTIVLTGAMIPTKMVNSDAHFNLGLAVALVQREKPGIYIALNGFAGPWQEYCNRQ